jgi:AcrR family transcriptional regulator
MTGPREKNRQSRRLCIIQAATRLIEREGFDCTTVEKIAAKAGIGVGTFYNYFASKNDLAIELLLDEKNNMTAEAQAILQSPAEDAQEAITEMLYCFHTVFARKYNKKMLRGIYSRFVTESADSRREGIRIDKWQISLLGTLIEFLQQRGQVKMELKSHDVSTLLYNLANYDFLEYMVDDDITMEKFLANIQQHVSYLYGGIADDAEARVLDTVA